MGFVGSLVQVVLPVSLDVEDDDAVVSEPPTAPAQSQKSTSLLSADTLESLKYFTEIRQRNALANGSGIKAIASRPAPVGLGLGGYASDEDD